MYVETYIYFYQSLYIIREMINVIKYLLMHVIICHCYFYHCNYYYYTFIIFIEQIFAVKHG